MVRSMRYKQIERLRNKDDVLKRRVNRRRERNNKKVKHINNGLVSTLTRVERKIRNAFDGVPSGKQSSAS